MNAKGGVPVDVKLQQDLEQFFLVYRSRTEDIARVLPPMLKRKIDEETDLLKQSIVNRLEEFFRQA